MSVGATMAPATSATTTEMPNSHISTPGDSDRSDDHQPHRQKDDKPGIDAQVIWSNEQRREVHQAVDDVLVSFVPGSPLAERVNDNRRSAPNSGAAEPGLFEVEVPLDGA